MIYQLQDWVISTIHQATIALFIPPLLSIFRPPVTLFIDMPDLGRL